MKTNPVTKPLSVSETANEAQGKDLLRSLPPTGDVAEVSGSGEPPQLQLTRAELLLLVEYWWTVYLGSSFVAFLYHQHSSDGWRAQHRIGQIERCVGADGVDEAIGRAERDFAESADPESWHVFTNGTPEERTAFQAKVRAEMGWEPAQADEGRIDPAFLDLH